jgi:hypothetical protein
MPSNKDWCYIVRPRSTQYVLSVAGLLVQASTLEPYSRAHRRIPAYARRDIAPSVHAWCYVTLYHAKRQAWTLAGVPIGCTCQGTSIGSSVDALSCPISIAQTRCSLAGSTKEIVVGGCRSPRF